MTSRLKNLLNNDIVVLAILVLGALVIRYLLLPLRWINPDEGAHLMDARFLIQGLMPIADYGSRQPLYVFIIAAFIKMFGVTLTAGRLLPLFSSIGVAIMLYFLGKRLFNSLTGLLACGIYLFLPFVVMWSTIVKTEQLAIFFVCSSVYFLLFYSNKNIKKQAWIILSGISAACAFYVRQPTLYMPLAIITFLLFFINKNLRERLFLVGHFIMGYVAVVACFFAIFLNKMSFQHMLFSQLNPLNLVWNRLLHTFNLLPAQYRVVDSEAFRILNQDLAYTKTAWNHAIFFSLFIIVGSILFFITNSKQSNGRHNKNFVLVLWAGFILLLYIFQSANRGFFSQYFTEALPPLILFVAAFVTKFYQSEKISNFLMSTVLLLFFVLVVAQKVFWQFYPGVLKSCFVFLFLLSIVFVWFISKEHQWKKKWLSFAILMAQAMGMYILLVLLNLSDIFAIAATFVVLYFILLKVFPMLFTNFVPKVAMFILVLSFLLTATFSGSLLGVGYEAVWSQQSLKKVKAVLLEQSGPSDTVLSGGMIWTFESGLAPFLNVTHPTEFDKKKFANFTNQFQLNRPDFIILDKYTVKKFSKYWDFITKEINMNYQLIAEIPNGPFIVKVFRVVHPSRGIEPAFAALD
jgi:4-amino-4-deoxy-L-arabinose transferase-like glycosyltransferase